MSFLELHDVSKIYGEGPSQVHALEHINLEVEAGSLVAVMGPSGSGKSTLLTIAGSLEDPSCGEVIIGGAALSHMSRDDKARLRRRSIGFVFQDFNLLPGLTAAENVSLPLELDGLRASKAHATALQVLEMCIRDRSLADQLGLGAAVARQPGQGAAPAALRWPRQTPPAPRRRRHSRTGVPSLGDRRGQWSPDRAARRSAPWQHLRLGRRSDRFLRLATGADRQLVARHWLLHHLQPGRGRSASPRAEFAPLLLG